MTDDRYKKIMTDLGMPNSHSLLLALKQVANETAQEIFAARRPQNSGGYQPVHIDGIVQPPPIKP